MNNSNKKDSFILQAGFLAAAGFISRIIGLLYVSPVAKIIGTVGIGYYSLAYNYYAIVLLLSSYSIPSAISKVISQKLSLNEYRNAHRIFMCAMYYVLGVGLAASCLLFFGAGLFVEETAIPVLRVLAPTVFLYGILGVLRGYFQAHKSMVQTSFSQIIEQIMNAAVSIGAAYGCIKLFAGAAASVADADPTKRAVYGAMGSALGTGMGVVVALLFMAGIYALNRPMFQRRIRRDRTEHVDSYAEISKMIFKVVTPFIISTAIYNLSTALNGKIFTQIMIYGKGVAENVVTGDYGVFSGQAMKIVNIPIAFASAMAAAIIPTVSQLVAKMDYEQAREKIAQAVKTIMVISIPSAVGLCVLCRPVTWTLFYDGKNDTEMELASKVLALLGITVVFFALSTLSNSILQGIGRVNTPIYNALIALVIQTAVLCGCLYLTEMNVYALVLTTAVYSGLMCILNQYSVRKALGYRQEIMGTFLLPLIASLIMGAVTYLAYELLRAISVPVIVSLGVSVGVAVVVYFVVLILIHGITEQEMRGFPKGHLLVKAAKKCRLLR